ncbi:MAG: hypothetical protein ABJA50_02425, partial [Chloroflexota bacterium]
QQGYPISDELQETSDTNGKTYTTQYFERAVFEYHPENPAPHDMLLALLGTLRYHEKYPAGAPNQQASVGPNSQFFPETGMIVGGLFLAYWHDHGGSTQNGYPISNDFVETSDLDGKPYSVQYFERAVFEYHPENQSPYDVLLSQLGTFSYQSKHGQTTLTPTPITTPTTKQGLNGVFMTSTSEGWAVGDLGTILHYTGGSWREVSSPVTHDLVRNLSNVYMTSPDEGWAVGTFSTIIHFVNGKWENASGQPGEHLNDVKMVTPTEGWAVGGGTGLGEILHYTGGQWTLEGTPMLRLILFSLAFPSPNEGWIVGDKILHLTGGTWEEQPKPVKAFLRSVFMTSTSEGWAVGDNAILHYTDGQWVSVALPVMEKMILTDVFMASSNEGWAVGISGILHYNGTAWEQVPGTSAYALNSLYMTSSEEGWAVGAYGTILHYHDGLWAPYR